MTTFEHVDVIEVEGKPIEIVASVKYFDPMNAFYPALTVFVKIRALVVLKWIVEGLGHAARMECITPITAFRIVNRIIPWWCAHFVKVGR